MIAVTASLMSADLTYQARIRAIAPDADPRLIEAWLLLEHGEGLAQLSPFHFADEVRMAAACVHADPEASERLAKTMGLRREA
jgi:hypothetical protein